MGCRAENLAQLFNRCMCLSEYLMYALACVAAEGNGSAYKECSRVSHTPGSANITHIRQCNNSSNMHQEHWRLVLREQRGSCRLMGSPCSAQRGDGS
jgi:hypothetical protein